MEQAQESLVVEFVKTHQGFIKKMSYKYDLRTKGLTPDDIEQELLLRVCDAVHHHLNGEFDAYKAGPYLRRVLGTHVVDLFRVVAAKRRGGDVVHCELKEEICNNSVEPLKDLFGWADLKADSERNGLDVRVMEMISEGYSWKEVINELQLSDSEQERFKETVRDRLTA